MELKDGIAIIRKRLRVVVLTIFVLVLATMVFSIISPTRYKASISLLVQPVREPIEQYQYGGYYAIQASELFVNTIIGWLKTPEIAADIYKKAGVRLVPEEIPALVKKIQARKIPPQNIEITLKDPNSSQALRLAEAVVAVIQERTDSINKSSGSEGSRFSIISTNPLIVPQKPNLFFNFLISLFLGLVLGIIFVFLFEYFSKTINFPKAVYRIFGSMGVIIFHKKIKGLIDPESPLVEKFRFLRANILPPARSSEVISLLVSEISDDEQSPAVAANLALSFARGGKKTILIDADFERPRIHELFGLPNQRGFSEFLFDIDHLDSYLSSTREQNLKIIPSGMTLSYSADFIARADLEKMATALAKKAEVIIYNVPSLSTSADAFPLFDIVKKAILVIRLGKSTIASASYINRFLKERGIEQYALVIS